MWHCSHRLLMRMFTRGDDPQLDRLASDVAKLICVMTIPDAAQAKPSWPLRPALMDALGACICGLHSGQALLCCLCKFQLLLWELRCAKTGQTSRPVCLQHMRLHCCR